MLAVLACALFAHDAGAEMLLPPATSSTTWSVASDHKTILLAIDHGHPAPFMVKGVDYSPRPINDSSKVGPSSDYFWGDPSHLTYELIWTRDVWGSTYNDSNLHLPDGWIRQLGANSIRTYAWWKWAPQTPADYSKWRDLDWSVGPRIRFGDDSTPAGFAAYPAHDGGDQFLDLCWNNGKNPIYVVIGISVDPWTGFASANFDSKQWHDEQIFLAKTTKWLAKRYGYHPAVLGFAIGNETNLPFDRGTDRFIEYWNYLDSLGAIVKRYAPGKLTMSAFEDYPHPERPMLLRQLVKFKNLAAAKPGSPTIPVCVDMNGAHPGTNCVSPHRRPAYPADVYSLDVWGFNSYRKPETEDAANFKHWVVDGYYTQGANHYDAAPNPEPKPLLLTEWGAPASVRTREGQPPHPPNPEWVNVDRGMPGEFHGASGYRTAKLIQQIGNDIYGPDSKISVLNGGVLAGGYIFELQDEWWKEDQRNPASWATHDTTTLTFKFPFGEEGHGFSSFWDEEWFGLLSTNVSPARLQQCAIAAPPASTTCEGSGAGASTDPVLTAAGSAAWLNGGADELTPRAGYYALQSIFKGNSGIDAPAGGKAPVVLTQTTCASGPSVFCQVGATNAPTRFEARGLPAGLQLDPRQGIIFGSYNKPGNFSVRVTAINESGKSAETSVMATREPAVASAAPKPPPNVTAISFKPNHHP